MYVPFILCETNENKFKIIPCYFMGILIVVLPRISENRKKVKDYTQ